MIDQQSTAVPMKPAKLLTKKGPSWKAKYQHEQRRAERWKQSAEDFYGAMENFRKIAHDLAATNRELITVSKQLQTLNVSKE